MDMTIEKMAAQIELLPRALPCNIKNNTHKI